MKKLFLKAAIAIKSYLEEKEMKILVTGAAGSIGSNLIKIIKKSEYEIFAVDNFGGIN